MLKKKNNLEKPALIREETIGATSWVLINLSNLKLIYLELLIMKIIHVFLNIKKKYLKLKYTNNKI